MICVSPMRIDLIFFYSLLNYGQIRVGLILSTIYQESTEFLTELSP
jgi:hypothetical protein